jgi:hypothetical protein
MDRNEQLIEKHTQQINRKIQIIIASVSLIAAISLVVAFVAIIVAITTSRSVPASPDPCAYNPLTCKVDTQFRPFKKRYTQIPERVLVVGSHPDDIETCAGGTLAKWAAAGSHIYYIMITNGEKGTGNASKPEEEVAKTRQSEQLAAAAVIGVKDVYFLNIPDGSVSNDQVLRERLVYYIRLIRPTHLLTWNPMFHLSLYIKGLEHTDHRAAGAVCTLL